MSLLREGEIDAGIIADLPGTGEVADAGVEQHDAGDRQGHGRLHVLLGVAWRRRVRT